jgi:hypothetical protein
LSKILENQLFIQLFSPRTADSLFPKPPQEGSLSSPLWQVQMVPLWVGFGRPTIGYSLTPSAD